MGVQRYTKLPITIEAIQFNGGNASDIARWVDPMVSENELPEGWWIAADGNGAGLMVPTTEGVMRADIGDWIIKGVKGEFYPCKPDIFAMSYRPVVSAS